MTRLSMQETRRDHNSRNELVNNCVSGCGKGVSVIFSDLLFTCGEFKCCRDRVSNMMLNSNVNHSKSENVIQIILR